MYVMNTDGGSEPVEKGVHMGEGVVTEIDSIEGMDQISKYT